MSKYIFTLLLLIFTSICFGQRQKCKLILNDETIVAGFAKVNEEDKIEFSSKLDEEVKIWDHSTVKKIIIFDQEPIVYEYFKLTKEASPTLLLFLVGKEVFPSNNLNLYVRAKEARNLKMKDGKEVSLEKRDYKSYYLKKRFVDEITVISSQLTPKKLKNKLLKYFKDCPVVIEKLRYGGYFGIIKIIDLVKEYNFLCVG